MKSFQVESAGHKLKFDAPNSMEAAELFVGSVGLKDAPSLLGDLLCINELPFGHKAFILTQTIVDKLKVASPPRLQLV